MKRHIITLLRHPKAAPQPSDFTLSKDLLPDPADVEMGVKVLALSLDPYTASAKLCCISLRSDGCAKSVACQAAALNRFATKVSSFKTLGSLLAKFLA